MSVYLFFLFSWQVLEGGHRVYAFECVKILLCYEGLKTSLLNLVNRQSTL